MKRFATFLVAMAVITILNFPAFAQQKETTPSAPQATAENGPTAKPSVTNSALPPKLLTVEQKQKLAEAQNSLQLARANFEAAEAKLRNAQLFVEGLGLVFMVELKVDKDLYSSDLENIDTKIGAIGFKPKAPPTATDDPKKPKP